MYRANIAEEIINALDLQTVLEYYGLQFDKNGYTQCPFHSENTGSFTVFNDHQHYKCFGCGEWGNAIDFVRKYFGLQFYPAMRKLDSDFNLNVFKEDPRISPMQRYVEQDERKRIDEARARFIAKLEEQYDKKCIVHEKLFRLNLTKEDPELIKLQQSLDFELNFLRDQINSVKHGRRRCDGEVRS